MQKQGEFTSQEITKLFAGGTVILFRCDSTPDFPLTFVSSNCKDILGFDASYFLKNPHGWSDRIHPEDREAVFNQFKQVIRDKSAIINEYRFKRKDGICIWLRDEIKVINDAERDSTAILGSSFDITSRKRAEIELQDSKKLYQSVVEHIKDIAFTVDDSLKWVYLNRAWIETTGFSLGKALRQPFTDFIHAEDRKICTRIFEDLLSGSKDFHSFIVRLLKSGHGYIWVEINAQRIKNTSADERSVISGTMVNVTAELAKQKEIEELNLTLEKRIRQRSQELSEEIEKRKEAQDTIKKRLTFEQFISKCSNLLLESSEPEAVDQALAMLQEISKADRVYIFENYKDEDGILHTSQVHEACGTGVEPQIDNQELKRINYQQYPWWHEMLSENRIINAIVEDLPPPEKRILQSQDIKSILVFPLFMDKQWFGFMGFDDVRQERIWNEDEIILLKTASEIIAAYKKRLLIRKSLMRQKEYTEAILDSLPSIYVAIDKDLNPVHWNKNAENLTGFSHAEISSMSVFDFIAPKDHQELTVTIDRLKHNQAAGTELKVRKKNGEVVDFFWRGRFKKLEDEDLFLCIGLDISSQKETKQELMYEKRLSEAIIDSLPGIFYMLDEEGKYLKWNENLVHQFGYSDEEIANMHPSDFFGESEYDKVSREIQRVFEEGDASIEVEVTAKDGTTIPYYLTGKRFEQDDKQYLIGSGYDVTEKKQAMEQLRKSEEMFRNLFLKAPSAIVMVDVYNHVLMVNKSFENLFGYSEEEIEGKDLDKIIVPPEDYHSVPKMPAITTRGSHIYQQAQRIAKNGERKHVFVGSIPIYIDDEPYVGFGMYIDITEKVKYEKQISDSLQEKQVLLQEIHHRVKNNLAVVSGLIQLQMYEVDQPDLHRILQESQSRVQTMALIHEKLYQSQDLSRISCRSYIEELIQTIESTFKTGDRKITINTEIDDVELNINKAVPFALLVNEVITNAFEHAFVGRRRGTIEVRLTEKDSCMFVTIQDDGVGLPQDFSIENEGTLGMTLIHNFLQQLDAEWNLESKDGTKLEIVFGKENIKGSASSIV